MRVEYDHYSKRCPSYSIPPVHPDDVPSLLEKVEKVSSCQNIYFVEKVSTKVRGNLASVEREGGG